MENNKLEVSKTFTCSKHQLIAAWTEPGQLKQWWHPLGKQLSEVKNDLKEGGNIAYTFDNGNLVISGMYEKFTDDLLEYTWNWKLPGEPVKDADYKLSVRFEGAENESKIYVSQSGFKQEESIDPHQHGWHEALEQLASFLDKDNEDTSPQNTQLEAARNSTIQTAKKQKPEISGYNETPEQLKVAGG